jgi:hypothetical protein
MLERVQAEHLGSTRVLREVKRVLGVRHRQSPGLLPTTAWRLELQRRPEPVPTGATALNDGLKPSAQNDQNGRR